MKALKYLALIIALMAVNNIAFSQLKLGTNPTVISKSSILELESNKQGVLFPRITDTAGINALNPPDGTVIFSVPQKQLMIRSNGFWQQLTTNTTLSIDTSNIINFSQKVRSLFSGSGPITYANGTFGITQATAGTSGFLSSADWNTFNSKGSGSVTTVGVTTANGVSGTVTNPTTTPAISLTLGAITPASVAATGTVTGSNLSGTNTGNVTLGTANGLSLAGQAISMGTASTSTTGSLTNTDWNTFNSKLGSVDTANITNFAQKVRSLFSGTAPITYSNGTIGITQATTSTNGYLSSIDWNTFNSKGSGNGTVTSASVVTANGVSGTVTNPTTTPAISLTLGAITPTSVAATGTVTGSNLSGTNTGNVTLGTTNGLSLAGQALSLATASTSTTGALSNTDWNTFNSKGSGSVTTVGVTTANGVSGTVTNPTTTPAISLTLGAITPASVAATGTVTGSNISGSTSGTNSGDVTIGTANGLSLAGQAISMGTASTSTTGALSSTDWNTFNNKGSGNGTVTSASVVTANGVSGTVTNPTTTPAISLTLGAITPASVAATGTVTGSNLSGTNTGNVTIGTANGLSLAGQAISMGTASTSTTGSLTNTDWNTFNSKLGSVDTANITNFAQKVRSLFSGTTPITYSNGTIGVTQATTTTNGYLSSTDWNTFNSKGSGNGTVTSASVVTANGVSGTVTNPTTTPAISLTLGAITPASVAATGTVTGSNLSGTNTGNVTIGTANGLSLAGQALSMATANTSTTGALSNTDWNTFNSKGGGSVTSVAVTTANGVSGTVTNPTTSPAISLTLGAITPASVAATGTVTGSNISGSTSGNNTGDITIGTANGLSLAGQALSMTTASTSTTGALTNTDWNTFNNKLSTVDTTNIANFSTKVRSLFSGSAPINYSNGAIGITQATTSANGYLSSTDWNTFNNKASSASITGTTNYVPKFTSGTAIGNSSIQDNGSVVSTNASNGILATGTFGSGGVPAIAGAGSRMAWMPSRSAFRAGYVSGTQWDSASIGNYSTALGYNTIASGAYSLALGTSTTASSSSAIALGFFATANGTNSTAIGNYVSTNGAYGSVIIGDGNTTVTNNDVTNQLKTRFSGGYKFFTDALGTDMTKGLSIAPTTGNVGIGTATFDFANPEKLLVDAGTTSSVNVISAKGTLNNYLQLNIQNKSNGANASSDLVATADNGNETTNYIDLGINSSGYTGGVMGGANDAYLYNLGNNLLIGTGTAAKSVIFTTGGTSQATNERMRIDGTGKVGIGTATPSTALHINGTNPLTLTGLQNGSLSDSILTITGGTVKKLSLSALSAFGITGGGTTNYIPKFTSGSAIGNSTIQDNGSLITTTALNGIVSTGTFGSGASPDISGAGTRMMWMPSKSAFRAGNVAGATWDSTNVGTYSTAFGKSTRASGSVSFASGDFSIASGNLSTAMGSSTTASGSASFAVGDGAEASGTTSTAMGSLTSATGDYSTAIGNSSTASGANSIAFGTSVTAAADNSLAIGNNVSTNPFYLGSMILGDGNGTLTTTDAANQLKTRFSGGYKLFTDALGTDTAKGMNISANSGNVGIGAVTFNSTNPEKLLVNAGTASVNAIVGKGNINNYLQLNIQNLSSGTSASSDVVATANNGTETTNYVDMGINSSGYTAGVMGGANDAYLYNLGNNMLIGAGSASKSLIFVTGGTTQATNERMRIDGNGNVGVGTTSATSKFEVNGSVGNAITVTSNNLTLDNTYYTVILNGTNGNITLPAASTCTRRIYVIVNQNATTRTISSYLAYSGSASTTIAANASMTIQSNGTNWYRIQ